MDARIIPDQVGDRRLGVTSVCLSAHRPPFQTASLLADTASRSRRAFRASLAGNFLPLRSEGAGNAGRPMRPIAACAMSVIERTRVSQVTPESPGIPHAMVYGL